MKIKTKLLSLILAVSATSISYGITLTHTWTDVDIDGNEGQPHFLHLGTGEVFESEFDLKTDGFIPGVNTIYEATVSFAFSDDWFGDDAGDERVTINLGLETLWTDLEVDGIHNDSPVNYDFYSTSVSASLIANLNVNGILSYRIEVTEGDTYLKEARLTALGVPDSGASLTLVLIGSLGLGLFSRRNRR